jgi:hypothetical protein
MTSTETFVVTNGSAFLAWDDKGAMATGYPMWVPVERARLYPSKSAATASAVVVRRMDKVDLWVQELTFTLGERLAVTLPEEDPEWAEYQRLNAKFKNA